MIIIIILAVILIMLLLIRHIDKEQFTFFSAAEAVCGSRLTPGCVQYNVDNIISECNMELAVSNGSCPPECYGSFDPACLRCMQAPCDQYCLTDGPESYACQECLSFCDRPIGLV